MPILDVDKCDEMYHNDSSSSDIDTEVLPKNYRLIYDDMICAGYPEGKKDSCQVKIEDKSHGPIMICSRYYTNIEFACLSRVWELGHCNLLYNHAERNV